jgi:hypothetical protein
MTRHPLVLAAGFAFALAALLPAGSPAQEKKSPDRKAPGEVVLKPTVDLTGSLADPARAALAPKSGVIVTQKEYDRVTRAWNVENPPKVDFDKELVLVASARSSQMTIEPKLDETGDLRVNVLTNKDDTAGVTRYALRSVLRNGVRTINGKPIPVE